MAGRVLTHRLPDEGDADKNGDVFAYDMAGGCSPVPWRAVREAWGRDFFSWRAIKPSDYLNKP